MPGTVGPGSAFGARRAVWLALAAFACMSCAGTTATRALRSQEQQDPRVLTDGPDAGYRSDFRAQQGLLVQARGGWTDLYGEFDGDTTLVGPDVIAVPDADGGLGWELGIGGMQGNFFGMVTYRRAELDASIGSFDSDIEYKAFTLQAGQFLRANEPVQPYWMFELLFALADLQDASTDGVVVGDGKLRDGWGIGMGGGVAWWLGEHLALDARALFDYVEFGEAEGVADDDEDIQDGLYGTSLGLSIGLTWSP